MPGDAGGGPDDTGDPFGVARFDLSAFLDGLNSITCKVSLQPSPPPDPLTHPQSLTGGADITNALIMGDRIILLLL